MTKIFQLLACSILALTTLAKLKAGECEVCINVVKEFARLGSENGISTIDQYNDLIIKTCKNKKLKENRFCYYIGATDDAATKIINAVAKPLSFYKPAEKICEELKKKDQQICELKYDKQIDWSTVDLKKLKVKELKKILSDWGEVCKGCYEKSDYVRTVEKFMPQYVKKSEL